MDSNSGFVRDFEGGAMMILYLGLARDDIGRLLLITL